MHSCHLEANEVLSMSYHLPSLCNCNKVLQKSGYFTSIMSYLFSNYIYIMFTMQLLKLKGSACFFIHREVLLATENALEGCRQFSTTTRLVGSTGWNDGVGGVGSVVEGGILILGFINNFLDMAIVLELLNKSFDFVVFTIEKNQLLLSEPTGKKVHSDRDANLDNDCEGNSNNLHTSKNGQ
mmetsp:Transcript_23019/g.47897  ORF Transcript_23019/g.47897 Transcript_23019/m.47897 type:complete len:182 (+) Transcript_23019:130-675(+)